jgi:hypothetical protein
MTNRKKHKIHWLLKILLFPIFCLIGLLVVILAALGAELR